MQYQLLQDIESFLYPAHIKKSESKIEGFYTSLKILKIR
jgi:hypothetical protein